MNVLSVVTARAVRFGGEPHRGWLPEGALVPDPTPVRTALLDLRILEDHSGVILEWQSRNTEDSGDTWHSSVAEAQEAARESFGIGVGEWAPVNAAS
jgi:hypothetical protein